MNYNLIYGKNPILLIVKIDPRIINKIYLNWQYSKDPIVDTLKAAKVDFEFKDSNFLNEITDFANHQNFVAEVKDPRQYQLEMLKKIPQEKNPFVIMIDSITDPHNFGAILRVADAVGVEALIYSKNRQVKPNATVAKVSTGAMYSVKLIEVTNLTRTCETLKKWGYWIIGSALDADSINVKDFNHQSPMCLIIGSEGKGISKNLLSKVDIKIKLPMQGKVQSLNASVAAGILSYKIKNLI